MKFGTATLANSFFAQILTYGFTANIYVTNFIVMDYAYDIILGPPSGFLKVLKFNPIYESYYIN